MQIFTSFVTVGLICMIASLIYDMTKLTPGHITSLFVIIGAFFGIFGWYDVLIQRYGYGLSLPITSFGNSLLNSSYEGYHNIGLYGIFNGMLVKTSLGISATIIFSFIMSLIAKPKD